MPCLSTRTALGQGLIVIVVSVLLYIGLSRGLSAQGSPDYSPFVLRVRGHAAFDTITFKNVTAQHRAELFHFEVLAESMAQSLRHSTPRLQIDVIYRPPGAHLNDHLLCDDRHLYVDFWGLRAGDKGGYSLWSGCGVSDRFHILDMGPITKELSQHLEQMASSMTRELVKAEKNECYQKNC